MTRERRDWIARPLVEGWRAVLLRSTCHGLHMALVVFGLLGWIIPQSDWLVGHIVFLPILPFAWWINDDTCPLNNLETWLTTGRWRNPGNVEEGAFLRATVERYFDVEVSERAMNIATYGLMSLAWALSWLHLALRKV